MDHTVVAGTRLDGAFCPHKRLFPALVSSHQQPGARWQPDTVPANWRDLRRRWDLLHAIRVVFLVIALILLVASCVY